MTTSSSPSDIAHAHAPAHRESDVASDADDSEASVSASDPLAPDETEKEPTSPTAPLAPYPPLPPADARSRAPEFYGFVAWTGTYLLFALYLLWAFLPDDLILALGVSWYPNREWSLLIPAYGMVLVLLTYFTYFALALAGTPSFADMRTITDSKAHFPRPRTRPGPQTTSENDVPDDDDDGASERNRPSSSSSRPRPRGELHGRHDYRPFLAHARPDAIPELYDIPLGLVNRVLYGPPRRPNRRHATQDETASAA